MADAVWAILEAAQDAKPHTGEHLQIELDEGQEALDQNMRTLTTGRVLHTQITGYLAVLAPSKLAV